EFSEMVFRRIYAIPDHAICSPLIRLSDTDSEPSPAQSRSYKRHIYSAGVQLLPVLRKDRRTSGRAAIPKVPDVGQMVFTRNPEAPAHSFQHAEIRLMPYEKLARSIPRKMTSSNQFGRLANSKYLHALPVLHE